MRTRTKASFGVTAILLVGVCGGGFLFMRAALERSNDAYAVQHTAELVVEYLKRHTNQWPSSWSGLRTAQIGDQEYFRKFEKETGGYSAFLDDLERRVDVDFTVKTPQLVAAIQSRSVPPFRVIWLRSGRNTHWSGLEPNELVAEYIRGIKKSVE